MLTNNFLLTLNFLQCPDFLFLSKSNIPGYEQSGQNMQIFSDETGNFLSCITRLAAAAGRVVSLMSLNEAFII